MQALNESAELFRTHSGSSGESSAPSTTTTERVALARDLGAVAAGQAVASEQASRVEALASTDAVAGTPQKKMSRAKSIVSLVSSKSKHDLNGNATAKPVSSSQAPNAPAAEHERVDVFQAPVPAKLQKVCDLATKLVGDTLDLSLCYLVAVRPNDFGVGGGETELVSAHNLPSPVPVFDAPLHLRALRAPERGLLYQNPTVHEGKEDLPSAKGQDASPYASAVLLPVGEERQDGNGNGKGGFVLAGFTSDQRRVFGGEDVAYLRQFAKELERYVADVDLA